MNKDKHSEMDDNLNGENIENKTPSSDNLADSETKGQSDGDASPGEAASEGENQEESLLEKVERLNDAHLRLMAEYDNYRKRTMKEKADLIKTGGEKALLSLLPVIDDFERAIRTIEETTDIDALKEGVSLIFGKFEHYLGQNGVKKINTDGAFFDADLHEAVATVPAQDETQKGKIIDALQNGYTLNEKVLRHSKVVVAN
jgi:molecular chaperone GrpE